MVRPTRLQSLFNRPSQSYYSVSSSETPPSSDTHTERNYYSAKQELTRIALAPPPTSSFAPQLLPRHSRPSPIRTTVPESLDSSTDTDTENEDIFYTPRTSPSVSPSTDHLPSPHLSNPSNKPFPNPSLSSASNPSQVSSRESVTSGSELGQSSTFSFQSNGASSNWTSPPTSLVSSTLPKRPLSSQESDKLPASRNRYPPGHSPLSSHGSQPLPVNDPISYQIEIIDSSSRAHPKVKSRQRHRPRSSQRNPASMFLHRKMSAVFEEEETESYDLGSGIHRSTSRSSSILLRRRSSSRRRTTTASPLDASDPQVKLTHNIKPPLHSTVDIPAPLPLIGASAPAGLSHLVLPKAAYHAADPPTKFDGKVDLISLGLSRTAMACVEIQRDAAAKLIGKRYKKNLRSEPNTISSSPLPVLGLGSYLKPPSKVASTQILVQIWAVALDGLDGLIVREKLESSDNAGFVPGRSFVGKAVEVGYNISDICKGEWVYGLSDVQRSGALTEFILIDRRRVNKAPLPTADLTVEQISLLPLIGIPAHRAVNTFAACLSREIQCPKALVFQAQKHAGALACQELKSKGVQVVAQIPGDPHSSTQNHARAVANGASIVVAADPLSALAEFGESEFDIILDTLGGKQIWDGCKRILRHAGQFTTLVGDSQTSIPTMNTQFKSNLRSLRRTFMKKDNKMFGYSWIVAGSNVDQGDDVHDTLAAVTHLTDTGVYRPVVDQVVRFEKAPDFFPVAWKLGEPLASIVVVRIVG